MIKNIVFDMGNVLIVFDPGFFMDNAGITDPEDRRLVMNELFVSVEWALMDLGAMKEQELEARVMERIPEHLKERVRRLIYFWWEGRSCVPGMEALAGELKEAGYHLYLLSNASVMQHEYWPRFAISRLFDGKLISCDTGVVKPNPEIYRMFTEKFGLIPGECVFIDDQPANAAAAEMCGWKGIVFHGDAGELREKLKAAGLVF